MWINLPFVPLRFFAANLFFVFFFHQDIMIRWYDGIIDGGGT
jgi:hypothetical protein